MSKHISILNVLFFFFFLFDYFERVQEKPTHTLYQSKRTPLFWCAQKGHIYICKLLVGANADVNLRAYVSFFNGCHKPPYGDFILFMWISFVLNNVSFDYCFKHDIFLSVSILLQHEISSCCFT